MNEKTLNSSKIYTCHFMTLYEDDVELDKGVLTKRVYIKHPGAAAVLPFTKDRKLILTKQFRYPIRQISIEIPAGKKEHEYEDALECAKRELEEETGYISSSFLHLQKFYTCLGYSNEIIDIFIAHDCEVKKNPKSQDIDEHIDIFFVTIKEAYDMIERGEITDAKTIMAIHKYMLLYSNK